jgi:hypothetical protein
MSGPRVIVMGMLGGNPFAGIAWQVLHYLEGLRRLGCEVAYVEDTQAWPYDPERNAIVADPGYAASYLERTIGRLAAGSRVRAQGASDVLDGRGRPAAACTSSVPWAYVPPEGGPLGLSEPALARLFEQADALLNLSGATVLREPHMGVPVRIYLETDPVLPQIEVDQGRAFTIELLAAHTHHFSFGEKLGHRDCGVPVGRFEYRPTRQPVILDWWTPPPEQGERFTTVTNWRQTRKDVVWRGERWFWSKDREFERFLELPARSGRRLELALSCEDEAVLERLREHGWELRDALVLTRSIGDYRSFVAASRAEFTVAKDQNVRLRSGWFSDRSACYLACGRPVITQDTGFGDVLPTGEGLFAFATIEDILAAMDEIDGDYERHRRAARAMAQEHFAAERVLGSLLERCGLR